jgi:UDP-N-acetyl-D-galactosamine dehydrogenase
MSEHIAVIGLGYVGLPVALALADEHPDTIGFDVSNDRVEALRVGRDGNEEVETDALETTSATFTADPSDLEDATFYIVTVPTPIDDARQPDLSILEGACRTVGPHLDPGDLVVLESTVYPGVTRDHCGPILEETSGLEQGEDFKLGYSPERINPGDEEHRFETIVKVVAGEDDEALERVAAVYESVVEAGVHRADSIEIAESAKVIENTQRDLNIALMNELAIIFDRMGVRTEDVLEAANTKWNFLDFEPGLVGGHCIGVDPYYLTHRAESLGHHPEIILAGRRINDGMSTFVAQKLVKLLIERDKRVNRAKVGVLGLTFKANVEDTRNSRVPEIVDELNDFGVECRVHDPMAEPDEAARHYGIELVDEEALSDLDGLVVAVAHDDYRQLSPRDLAEHLDDEGVLIDVKSLYDPDDVPEDVEYWSL